MEKGEGVLAGKFTANADDISFDPTKGRRILDSVDPRLKTYQI